MFVTLALVVAVQALIVSPAVLLSFSADVAAVGETPSAQTRRRRSSEPRRTPNIAVGDPCRGWADRRRCVGCLAMASSRRPRQMVRHLVVAAGVHQHVVCGFDGVDLARPTRWLVRNARDQGAHSAGSPVDGLDTDRGGGAGRVAAGSSQAGADRLDGRLWLRCALRVRFRWRRWSARPGPRARPHPQLTAAKLALSTSPAQASTVLMSQRLGRGRLGPLPASAPRRRRRRRALSDAAKQRLQCLRVRVAMLGLLPQRRGQVRHRVHPRCAAATGPCAVVASLRDSRNAVRLARLAAACVSDA